MKKILIFKRKGKRFLYCLLLCLLLCTTCFLFYSYADPSGQSVIKNIDYQHEQEGKQKFEYGKISIEDPANPGHGITIMDRNLGATTTGAGADALTGSYGYKYQWGNNYGFEDGCWTSNCSDDITTNAVSVTTDGAVWSDEYDAKGYYGDVFIKSTRSPYGYDYWTDSTDNSANHENLRGGAGDYDNNWGYDADNYVATNLTDRQGPCPAGTHVPSRGEWNALLKMWWATNSGNYECTPNNDCYYEVSYGTYIEDVSGLGIAKDFYDEMQIPFAGYRRYNDASLYAEGEGANLWSSSPSSASNPASRGFFLNSDGVYTYGLNDRTVAYSVRCFYDSYQPLTQSFSLSLHDESEMEIASGSVESGAVWTGVVPDLSDAKEGREFLGRYDIDDPDEKIFDLESTPITKNLILKPKFEIRQFTISFLDSDGTLLKVITQDFDSDVDLAAVAAPTKVGYTFAGWDQTIPSKIPSHDVTIMAQRTKNSSGRSGGGGRRSGSDTANHGSAENEIKDSVIQSDSDESSKGYGDQSDSLSQVPQNDDNVPSGANVKDSEKNMHMDSSDRYSERHYSEELIDAHRRAYENGLTQYADIDKARLDKLLNRSEMAKVTSIFATQFLNKIPDESKQYICSQYPDLWKVDNEMKFFIIQSCEFGYMGYESNGVDLLKKFRPYTSLTLAEASTVLSRLVRGNQYALDGRDWYKGHLYAVYEKELIDNISRPTEKITRGGVYVMLYRLVSYM